jgi:hypothetical protein
MDLGRVIVITRRVTTIPIQVTECIRWVIAIPIPSPAYNDSSWAKDRSSIARNGSSATRQQPIPNRQRFSSSRQKADHDDGKTGFAVGRASPRAGVCSSGWPRGRGQQRPGGRASEFGFNRQAGSARPIAPRAKLLTPCSLRPAHCALHSQNMAGDFMVPVGDCLVPVRGLHGPGQGLHGPGQGLPSPREGTSWSRSGTA